MNYKDIPYEEVKCCILQTLDSLHSATLAKSPARMAFEMGKLGSNLCRWLDEHSVQEDSE